MLVRFEPTQPDINKSNIQGNYIWAKVIEVQYFNLEFNKRSSEMSSTTNTHTLSPNNIHPLTSNN